MDEEKAFILHLSKNAPQYFTNLGEGQAQIEFINKQARTNSTFYRFDIRMDNQHRRILVKTPPVSKVAQPVNPVDAAGLDRPRLTSKADLATKSHLEYKMLTNLHAHFGHPDDQRFGALHVFDFLPEQRAIVMEESSAPSLRQVFAKTNRLRYPFRRMDLSRVFHNAGAWLRKYHAFPKLEHTQARHEGRTDFTKSIHSFTNFLVDIQPDKRYFQHVEPITTASADNLLPDHLPMGLGHGDYAMRNILVGNNERVIVFDTLGRWQVPIYEDIAYFLFRLKFAGIRAVSQGLAFNQRQLAKYEREFLDGYFGCETIPCAVIRLFEIQALLDYWSSQFLLAIESENKHKQGLFKKINFILLNRFLRKMLNQLLDEVSQKTPDTTAVFRKMA